MTDDPRPILFCQRCEADVVTLPDGVCPWCGDQVAEQRNVCACGAQARRHRTRCARCERIAHTTGHHNPTGRPQKVAA